MTEPTKREHPVAFTLEQWRQALQALGQPAYRAEQVFQWIHRQGISDPEKMTNLSLALRAELSRTGLASPLRGEAVHRAPDGARKLVLVLEQGGRAECVLIPMTREAGSDSAGEDDLDDELGDGSDDTVGMGYPMDAAADRVTLCVSTQVGCAMGCVFCASGKAGLVRGLGAEEIVSQVYAARRHLTQGEILRNIVLMGMGEPLHHYEQTARALRLLHDQKGMAMSLRRITVSTVGLIPGIKKLGADFEGKVGLAVSLHAADDATRDALVPMNRSYPLGELMQALREYPLPKRRRITIEYTLIDGKNDSAVHAERLVRLLRGLRVKVNLIPMNPIGDAGFRPSPDARVAGFQSVLTNAGFSCFIRTRRGDAVGAACGQLALRDESAP
jgi:23S rRNA (adenine2503-C2)-methyltransferase